MDGKGNMERLTEKFKDGRNILRKGIYDIFYVGFGRFFDGEAVDRLAEYEDLEEQGKLLKLPCAMGDTVYAIGADEENFTHFHCGMKISEFQFDYWMIPLFGKCVFLTEEEAKAALKELSDAAE